MAANGQPAQTSESANTSSSADVGASSVAIDESTSSILVRDPRLFHSQRRDFCRRLIESATESANVRRAEVDLTAASCCIRFSNDLQNADAIGSAFAALVQTAVGDWRGHVGSGKHRASTPGDWDSLVGYRLPDSVSFWESRTLSNGRCQLRHHGAPAGNGQWSQLAERIERVSGARACRTFPWSKHVTIEFTGDEALPDHLVDDLESALEHPGNDESVAPHSSSQSVHAQPVATGAKRLGYLTLAAGSFTLTGVALVIPGMPTVPFLLATSYYLARSSPWLDELLRHTIFFGPVLQDWEDHSGLSHSSKMKLIGLSLTIILVTVALTPMPGTILALVGVLGCVSVAGILAMPGISDANSGQRPLDQAGSLVLS